jgi:predicted AlkP superfamily phosphohydrolase/phosphomutase
VIGLDMADAGLVDAWAREGALPALRRIMDDGLTGRLETTADVLHTSTWPTIFTGTLPGKHGVYYPYQPCPGVQSARAIGPDQYGEPPFWQVLDRAGRRSIVFDAPETFPIEEFEGIQIFEWSTWAWYWRRMTAPGGLARNLTWRFGRPPLRLEARRLGFAMPDTTRLGRQLVESVRFKARVARWLMQRHPWDVFVVVFAEPHAAGHYFWPRDAEAAAVASGRAAENAEPLRAVYVALDAAIAEILEGCGDDVTVLVVSGDGAGPNHCGWHLLPEVLRRAGFARGAGDGRGSARPGLLQRLRNGVPPAARAAVSARLPWRLRDRLVSRLATADVDWSRTSAFCLPTDLEGCIRINLKGREPHGVVEPGAQYEALCAELAAVLSELRNPATGGPAVRAVHRTDRWFPGPRRDHLPDLVVAWNDGAEIREVESARVGLVRGLSADPRPGTHHPRSFVALRGPRVRAGRLEAGHHIADVAPTILSLLGVTPPASMDGRVLGTEGTGDRHGATRRGHE